MLSHLASVWNSPVVSPPNFFFPPRVGHAAAGGCYARLFAQGRKKESREESRETHTRCKEKKRLFFLGSPGSQQQYLLLYLRTRVTHILLVRTDYREVEDARFFFLHPWNAEVPASSRFNAQPVSAAVQRSLEC